MALRERKDLDPIGICHIISPKRLYGKEGWLLAFMSSIDRSRFSPQVITLTREEDTALADRLSNIDVPVRQIRTTGKFSFRAVGDVCDVIKSGGIRIVHSHDYKADLTALIAARKCGVMAFSTPHGWNRSGGLKLRLYQIIDHLILPFFDVVAPLSPGLYDSLRLVRREKRVLIPNFIDLRKIPRGKEFDINTVSFVGRLIPLKRVSDIIKAVSLVDNGGIRLQIIGEGPLRPGLEEMANDLGISSRVGFTGFRDDAMELLSRSSMLILPSTTEGMSRTAMAAMGMGKVVIGSDIPGMRALIEHGRTGILVPLGDPAAIAFEIDRMIGDRGLYDRIAKNAAGHIRENHSAKKAVREYEKLYEESLRQD